MFYKKDVIKNFAKFTGKHLCQISFSIKLQTLACNFIKKETLAQVRFCDFCDIFKNIFLKKPPVADSDVTSNIFMFSGLVEYHLTAEKIPSMLKNIKNGKSWKRSSSTKLSNYDKIWCKNFNGHI